ncbi:MAG: hypothetical protein IPK80_16655 [Nannocystis sp.]|nr:hypothetical protein [Nannocystis sp.]
MPTRSHAAALVTLLLAACNGDDPCEGAACHGIGFDAPEGGEIRVEYVRTPVAEYSRGVAFFKSSQTPESTPFPVIKTASERVCNDLFAAPMWPTAPLEASRYLDVGELSVTGGGRTIPLTRSTDYTDFLGRTHAVAYHFLDSTTMIAPSALYDVVMTGSDESAAATWAAQLGVPAQFDLIAPQLPLTLQIPRDSDLAITWEQPPQTIGQAVLGLVAFQDEAGALSHLCVTEAADDGFTVPKDVLAAVPPRGTLLRGHTTHELREFPGGRRFDVIGTWCYATPYELE